MNGLYGNWIQCFRQIFLQPIKRVVAMITKIFFHHAPEVFNGVELTMEFWQEEAQVPCSFDGLLNERFLLCEVRLKLEYPFIAACIRLALLLALPSQIWSVKATFSKDSFDTFRLIRIITVIWWKYHWLNDFLAIPNEPAIAQTCLLSTRSYIHSRNKQCILWVSWVTLRIVNQK